MYSNDSASSFRNKIYYPYYRNYVGSTTTVTKTLYDIDGVETQDENLATVIKYKVEVDKRLPR